MENQSYKDILLQENFLNNDEKTEYTYEEFMIRYNENKTTVVKRRDAIDPLVYEFFDEQNENICNIVDELKDKYSIDGFLNTFTYFDLIDMMMKNTSVEEKVNDSEESEFSDDNNEDENF